MLQFSVILPTYNRKQQLAKVIAGLELQTFDHAQFEVIVVSDGSQDGTDDYLRTLNPSFKLRSVFQPNQGVAATRNNGVSHASGRLILFIDDDVVPHPELLARHYQSHQQADFATSTIVIGPMLNPPDFNYQPWVEWEQQMLYKQYAAMDRGDWEATARQFYTGNCSIHLSYFKRFGGFDPSFRRAEDVELAYRMAGQGAKFVWNNQAIGYHYAQRSYASWLDTPYAYGRNDVVFTRERGQSWLVPTLMREYPGRSLLIRTMNRMCLDRSWLSLPLQRLSFGLALMSDTLNLKPLYRASFSIIFNLRYFQGMSDELGGRNKFFTLLASHSKSSSSLTDSFNAT